MRELCYKESWALKNWCFCTVELEKTLESPLNYKKIQPVHPKGNQSWIFIGGTDGEAETPIFGHLMRTDSFEFTLLLGKIEGGRRRRWQRMRSFDGITDMIIWIWVSSGSWWWTGKPGMLQSMWSQRVGYDWVTELNWLVNITILHIVLRSKQKWDEVGIIVYKCMLWHRKKRWK